MFTGIVEGSATVRALIPDDGNLHILLRCDFQDELKVDQSLSHNGVCLTVTNLNSEGYQVTAIAETLTKTNLGKLKPGDTLNLERCMPTHGRFDGHIVQGHVDCLGVCTKVLEDNGSWRYWFSHPSAFNELTVEKGSICVNGVSLTVVDSNPEEFSVAIIPYTWEHTNFRFLKEGDAVNLEFDILGKYMKKMLGNRMVG